MRIRLITIGNKMPAWVNQGFQEYVQRFSAFFSFELIEIPLEKRTKNQAPTRAIEQEGEKMLATIKPHHRVIALEIKGQQWSTEQLATHIKNWQFDGKNIDFLIGGPDGLSTICLEKAETKWSLGALTLPHPLVRIILVEQLYRAFSILQNHPYHRK